MVTMQKTIISKVWLYGLIVATVSQMLAGPAWSDTPLLNDQELARIGLRIAWQRPLPIYQGEHITQFEMRNDRLFLLTNTNYAVCLRRKDGGTIFMRRMAPHGFEVNGWELQSDLLLTAIGEVVTALGPDTGTTLGSEDFGLNLVDAPKRSEKGVFLAADDHRIHAINKNLIERYSVGASSNAPVTAIASDDDEVILATSAGDVLALETGQYGIQPYIRWIFQARDAVAAPLVVDDDSLYFASRDSYVYRLNLRPRAPSSVAEASRVTAARTRNRRRRYSPRTSGRLWQR